MELGNEGDISEMIGFVLHIYYVPVKAQSVSLRLQQEMKMSPLWLQKV